MKINGKVKFVVLPVKSFLAILDRIEDESDLRDIREAKSEPCAINPQISNSYLTLKCLTFNTHFGYKCFMQQTNEIKRSLKREYDLYSNAMAFYKNTLKEFEQKHQLSTQAFLKRFESGQLGDEADYFDWFAFAKLLAKWRKAQSVIRSAIQ